MDRKLPLAALIALLSALPASGRDVLTLGTGAAPAGGVGTVPVYIVDGKGTPIGSDAGRGNRIQGFAFKVMFPAEVVASVSFARAGVIATATPLFETTLQGTGWISYIGSFSESANPLDLTLNEPAPGNQVGALTITLRPEASDGSIIPLRLDPPGAIFSNQAGSVRATVANGELAVVNGTLNVNGALPAPTNLVATAAGSSLVNVAWVASPGAAQYQVWRSFNGGGFALVETTAGTSYADSNVVRFTTYLYRALAFNGSGGSSPFSNTDAATTIVFTEDPVLALATTVKAVHVTELRAAVNAMRTSAELPELVADATVAIGQPVRAQHIVTLRTALNEVRVSAVISSISFIDPMLTAGVTPVKAVHVQELRAGVK